MKSCNILIFIIQVLRLITLCFTSELESPQTESKEVDNPHEKVIDMKPSNGSQPRIRYALSPEDEKKMLNEMNESNEKIDGRFFYGNPFWRNNAENWKREKQKQIRYLYKTQNQWTAADLNTMGNNNWDKTGKLKVLIHGFTYQTYKSAEQLMKEQFMFQLGEAYIRARKCNVIIVDWTSLSKEPLFRYYVAAASTRNAGEAVATFLIELINRGLISSWSDIHIIGHSLGSHVAGVAGYEIQRQKQSNLGRISGLDPAGPLFDESGRLPADFSRVLDESDADFVDILHTNMGNIVTNVGALGSTVVAGSVDFFPNGGERQKRCTFYQDEFMACSHQASVKYFIESLTSPVLACPCDSWLSYTAGRCKCTAATGGTFMGDGCSERSSGKYYLDMQ